MIIQAIKISLLLYCPIQSNLHQAFLNETQQLQNSTSFPSIWRLLQLQRSATMFREGAITSANIGMSFGVSPFGLLLQRCVMIFPKWRYWTKPNSHELCCYSRLANPTNNSKMKTTLIPYHADKINKKALQPLQETVCTSVIMAVYIFGDWRWSSIIGQSRKSATMMQHGNASKISEDNPVT